MAIRFQGGLTWYHSVPTHAGTNRYQCQPSSGGSAMSERVLVTGAAGGQQGQTGRRVAEMLLERGVQVRAFVHRKDERSERLRALGAEIFEGDLLAAQSVREAARG